MVWEAEFPKQAHKRGKKRKYWGKVKNFGWGKVGSCTSERGRIGGAVRRLKTR